MNQLSLFLVACVLILAVSLAWSAEPITVKMKSLSYEPKAVEVHVGDSVVWSNEARTPHTATSDDEGKTFDTDEDQAGGIVEAGEVREGGRRSTTAKSMASP